MDVQAVGRVEITLLSNGQVQAQAKVANRGMLVMMCEMAKIDLERSLYAKEKEPQIEVPSKEILTVH